MVKRRRGCRRGGRGHSSLRSRVRRRYRVVGALRKQRRRSLVRRRRGLLTLDQAGRLGRVSRQGLHNWRKQKMLEVVKIDGEVYVVKRSLVRLLAVRRKVATLRKALLSIGT